jgi:hypothetical protein
VNVGVRRAAYESNVRGLRKEVDARLERIVARAARDGAAKVRTISDPSFNARASEAETVGGQIRSVVTTPRAEFWVPMFDRGTLGQREVPLKQPGRQEREWKVRRRGKVYKARRSQQAMHDGGIEPQYFMIRGKREAEQKLGGYLRRGI